MGNPGCATTNRSVGASFRTRSGVIVAVALAGAAAVGGALVVGACVPDLQVTALPGNPPPPACGNGFVDLAAGEACDPGEAGAPGCTSACAIDCGDGGFLDEVTGHCYFALGNANYGGATSGCDLQNAHLVTFVSRDELAAVAAWSAQRSDAAIWVGMRNDPNAGWIPVQEVDEPGFTPSCSGCFASADDAGAFPQPSEAGAPCIQVASATPTALWQRVPCTISRRTVCEREPPGSLSHGCNGVICIDLRRTAGAKKYVYFRTPSTPEDASKLCREFHVGSLVLLDSREEREELWAELAKIDENAKQVWIGLARDGDAGGEWRWDDGASVDGGRPTPWGAAQPASVDGGSPRAYIERVGGLVDSQLARNTDRFGQPVPQTLPFVCQFVDAPDAAK